MRKTFGMMVFVTAFVIGICFVPQSNVVKAGKDRGQEIIDKYLDKADHGRDKAKLNVALHLMTGHWSDVQKTIMLRAINSPDQSLESDVTVAFTPAEARDVFYHMGSFDVSDLRAVYGLASGKSATVRAWNDPARVTRLWQMNWALGLVRWDLSYDKQLFLVDLAEDAAGMTKERAMAWDARAAAIGFPRDVGRALFMTVGTGICGSAVAVASVTGRPKAMNQTCVCTTNSGNWSCNDTCHGAGTCSVDPGNCGFMWQWDCNGMCNNGDMEIQ